MGLKQNTWKLNQWYDQATAGNAAYAAVDPRTLWFWGENGNNKMSGIPGNPTGHISSPIQIPGTDWKLMQGSDASPHLIMLRSDGTAYTWAQNNYGQLGINQPDQSDRSSPTQVPGTTWVSATRTGTSTFATKSDGTFWAWGYNSNGELAQNNRTHKSSPVQIGSATNWPTTTDYYGKMDGGDGHIGAINTSGELFMWGSNSEGRLGLGDETRRSSPTQVPGTTWKVIGCGKEGSAGVKTDGTLWAWGRNEYGELGQNNKTDYSSPKQVGSGTDWEYVSVGDNNMQAVKTDGTMWGWGYNDQKQIGDGTDKSKSSPTQVPGTTWTKQMYTSYSHTAAIKTDGTLWTWGSNPSGQLGHNNGNSYMSPVQVGSASDWKEVGMADRNTFATREA